MTASLLSRRASARTNYQQLNYPHHNSAFPTTSVLLAGYLATYDRLSQSFSVSYLQKTVGVMSCRIAAMLGTLVWIFAGPCKVQAAQAVYTLSSVGSGSVGSHSFYMAPFTLTATADTSQITNYAPGVFFVPNITTTISVPGVITMNITEPLVTVINQRLPDGQSAFGISDLVQYLSLLAAPTTSTFENFDLSTSIGPITGSPGYCNTFNYFLTPVGFFNLSSVSDVTFQAIVVPEPSIVALFGLGLIGTAYYRRRPWRIPLKRFEV